MARKQKEPTPEEYLAREIKQARNYFTPDLTILYREGQRVQHGNIKRSVVREVLDGGKILVLDEITTENNYGNPYDVPRVMAVPWVNVEPYRTPEEIDRIPQLAPEREESISFYNSSVGSVVHRYFHAGIDLDPEYQREHVWELSDKVALIHSLLNGIEIGKLTFVRRDYGFDGPLYEVLDGKQRVSALVDFFTGQFRYERMLWCEMHPYDVSRIEGMQVLIADLPHTTTREQRIRHFLRLNTAGRVMDGEHLAKVAALLGEGKA
jgi:hypothetical protein